MLYLLLFSLLLIILISVIIKKSYYDVFNNRYQYYQPVYKYLIKKYPDFKCRNYNYTNDKGVCIVGNFYYYEKDTYKGLIISAHGIDNCKETLLAKLEVFARNGYIIYSYDNTGCGESGGDNIVGLGHSVIDLKNTINHLATIDVLNDYKWILYGHSWGGYAVGSVLNYQLNHKIDLIINKAGFNSVSDEFAFIGKSKLGSWSKYVVLPLIMMIENHRIKANKGKTTVSALTNANIPVLIMHSRDDKMVGFDSVNKHYKKLNNNNITYWFYDNRGHILDQKIDSLDIYKNLDDSDVNQYNEQYAQYLAKYVDYGLVNQELEFINSNVN